MTRVTISEARDNLSDLVNETYYTKGRATITRRNKAMAVLVPVEDLELLEAIEERVDAQEFSEALANWESAGKKSVPIENVYRAIGIQR